MGREIMSMMFPRTRGAEPTAGMVLSWVYQYSPHARGKRKCRPTSSEKIERHAIRRTQEYVTTQSYASCDAIEMFRFLQKSLEIGRLLLK